jgi:hypothetical protein
MTTLFDPELPAPAQPKRKHTPNPWHACPPSTGPERWAARAELEATLDDRSLDYETFARALATSCYVLSGPELRRVAEMVMGMIDLPCVDNAPLPD